MEKPRENTMLEKAYRDRLLKYIEDKSNANNTTEQTTTQEASQDTSKPQATQEG